MFTKAVVALCIQLAFLNVAYTQVLNRIVPIGDLQNQLLSFGPNLIANNVVPLSQNIVPIGQNVITPNIIPVNQCGPNVVPIAPNVLPIAPNVVESVLSGPLQVPATTTIIQDSSVANNLANALQLLIVSNLLSNTLPTAAAPVEVVSPISFGGLGGYSIVY